MNLQDLSKSFIEKVGSIFFNVPPLTDLVRYYCTLWLRHLSAKPSEGGSAKATIPFRSGSKNTTEILSKLRNKRITVWIL